jgi:sporulation protein YlmC with PRC-barrel domain
MRKTITLAAALLIAAPLAGSARAEGSAPGHAPEGGARSDAAGKHSAPVAQMPAGTIEADSIIGSKVRDAKGDDLGSVDELLLDPADGKVRGAVLSLGGVFGVGARKVEVPWSSLQLTRDGDDFAVVATRDALEKAPAYSGRQAATAGTTGTGATGSDAGMARTGDRDAGSED